MDQPAQTIFLHIPKTAGMSLHGLFVRNYRGRPIHNMGVRDITPDEWREGLARIRAMPPEELASYAVFKGHMIFGLHELLPGRADYITFLRDPVKRIVSHYKMVHRAGAFPAGHVFDPSLPLWGLDAYPDMYRSLDNYQVRAISGIDFELPFGACTEEHLAIAKANLDRYFKFVGLTEKFDLSLLLLRHICGWGWRYYISDNIGADSVKVSPEVIAKLKELNRFDYELYRYAEEKFDRLAAKYGWRLQAEYLAYRLGNRLHLLLHRLRHKLRR